MASAASDPSLVLSPDAGVRRRGVRAVSRRELVFTVALVATLWLLFSSTWLMLPFHLLVTLFHEANHALATQLIGGDVHYIIINEHGGGLTSWDIATPPSDTEIVFVASAGYLGTALIGALMIELAARLRRGRVASLGLAALITVIGLAWVPWEVEPDAFSAAATGSGSGDGRFTVLVCGVTVFVLLVLAVQPSVRLRRLMITGMAVTLCLASVEDLRRVLDWSSQGGHSDAAIAAEFSPLSSWMWAAIWLIAGAGACALGVWAAVSKDESSKLSRGSEDASPALPG